MLMSLSNWYSYFSVVLQTLLDKPMVIASSLSLGKFATTSQHLIRSKTKLTLQCLFCRHTIIIVLSLIVMENSDKSNLLYKPLGWGFQLVPQISSIINTLFLQVGDGTTSVIVLAGEMLGVAEQFLEQNMHPTVIIKAYRQALEDMVEILKDKVR